jgi:ribosomal protein S18 acetylase RimI-like enzyme
MTLRCGRPDDVGVVTQLLIADERDVRGESHWSEADTRDWFHNLGVNGELWIVEHEGQPVGVVGVFLGEKARGWVSVDPRAAGPNVGAALVELAEERAKQGGAASLYLLSFAENEAATRLLEGAGYCDIRRFYRMEVQLDECPPDPEWPAGISCTTFDLIEARALHEAINEAFADDYGHHPLSFDEWKRMRLNAPDFDGSLWFVARAGDEIAGLCRCTEQRWGSGWIDALGVRRRWRRRGLGGALLRYAFRELYDRGQRSVGLGVDTQNPSGATRLYERAGMRVVAENISFEKVLA